MVITADKNNTADCVYDTLLTQINSPYPIVLVNWVHNFVFNDALLGLKDYVLICFCEYGWDFEIKDSHIWGVNTGDGYANYKGEEWLKFDDWVKNNPPKIMFKRELLSKDVTNKVIPIEYPCVIENTYPLQTKEEFNNRIFHCVYFFGRSNEERLKLHARIWEGATKYGYSVGDNIYYMDGFVQNEKGKKYVSMHIPYYQRHPISYILNISQHAKFGIVPFGAGKKTFRHAEIPTNTIMLTWGDDLAWSADWVNGFNCIKCKIGEEVETIEKMFNSDSLYDIYIEGVKTSEFYRVDNYIKNYIEPKINNH